MAHQVVLSWQESSPSDPAVSYNIYRGPSVSGPFAKLANAPSTTYTDTTVVSGQSYSYEVTAVDSNGVESGDSNIITVEVPGPNAPTGLTGVAS